MPSRYICDVLEDMRKMYETRNFSGLLGTIEDAQRMATRMEAALYDKKTIEDYEEEAAKLKREEKEYRKRIQLLRQEIDQLFEVKDSLTVSQK